MTELELSQFRNQFNFLKQEKDILIKEHDELHELLKDEKVQRYIELINNNYDIPTDEDLAERAFSNDVISNNIMVYMGTYIYDFGDDCLTYDNDPKGTYKAYIDLETRDAYNILIDDCEEFETRNLAIYIPVSSISSHEYTKNYFMLRKWYLLQLLSNHQEIVIDQLKKLNEIKYKRLYLATHNNPTIELNVNTPSSKNDFDVESFVSIFPENGFIEKFCLTDEERKLVRIHRKNNSK